MGCVEFNKSAKLLQPILNKEKKEKKKHAVPDDTSILNKEKITAVLDGFLGMHSFGKRQEGTCNLTEKTED